MITKAELLMSLNGDLSLEYAAAIQYTQHAAVIVGPLSFSNAFLSEHAAEEFGHAKKVNDLINLYGGIPMTVVAPTFTTSDPVKMLQLDLEGEETARARYKERILQATEMGEFGIVAVLLEILADEDHHANELKGVLDV